MRTIWRFLVGIFKFIKPVFEDPEFAEFFEYVQETVISAILGAKDMDLDNDGKREHVLHEIGSFCLKAAWEYRESFARLALELVYNSLKKKGEV